MQQKSYSHDSQSVPSNRHYVLTIGSSVVRCSSNLVAKCLCLLCVSWIAFEENNGQLYFVIASRINLLLSSQNPCNSFLVLILLTSDMQRMFHG